MFRFAKPEYLHFLFLIPVLLLFVWLLLYHKRKKLQSFASRQSWHLLIPDLSWMRQRLKSLLMLLALSAIILALARPQFGSKLREVKREGVELVIALDVSNSMLAQDIKPNRLRRAKRAISKLLDKLHHDRVGLVVFAGDAYTQVPLTSDYAAYKMMLASVSANTVEKQGTAIGGAITHAMRSFNSENEMGKAIIIITDGESHADDPVAAAREAAEKDIRVYTIGLGSAQGAPIPVDDRGGHAYRRDKEGEIVITRLDETTLQEAAQAGEGKYIRGTDANMGLSLMFDEIGKMEKGEMESEMYADYEEQFQFVIALALLLLVWEFFVRERKTRWLQQLKIFKV